MNQVFVAEGSKYKYYPRPEPVFATQPAAKASESNGTKLTKGGEQRDTPDVGFDEVAALKDKLWGNVFVLWVRILTFWH